MYSINVQVDYYSRYVDVAFLPGMTSSTVIGKLKNIIAWHGVPETVVSDSGAKFSSVEFHSLSK